MNEKQQQDYEKYVKQVTPTHNLGLQMLKAFVTGGMICCIGQFILNYCEKLGLDKQSAGSWCSLLLVLCSVVLTGFNLYPKIVKWGGRGGSCAHYRICQLRGGPCHRVQEGRPGLWSGLQDFYHRRAGDPVRHLCQLGTGAGVLFWEADGTFLKWYQPDQTDRVGA